MCKIEHLFVVVPGNNVENLLGDCEKMTSFVHLFTHLFAVEGAVWVDPTFSFLNHSHLPCSHLIPTCHLIFFMYPCLSDHRSRTQQNSDSERLQIHDCHRSENRKSLKQQRRSANSSKLKRLEVPRSDSASTSNSLQKLHTLHCLVYLVVVAMGSCMKANRRLASERKKKMEEAQKATDFYFAPQIASFWTGGFLCVKICDLKEEARRLAVEAKFAEERRKAEEEKRRKDDEACSNEGRQFFLSFIAPFGEVWYLEFISGRVADAPLRKRKGNVKKLQETWKKRPCRRQQKRNGWKTRERRKRSTEELCKSCRLRMSESGEKRSKESQSNGGKAKISRADLLNFLFTMGKNVKRNTWELGDSRNNEKNTTLPSLPLKMLQCYNVASQRANEMPRNLSSLSGLRRLRETSFPFRPHWPRSRDSTPRTPKKQVTWVTWVTCPTCPGLQTWHRSRVQRHLQTKAPNPQRHTTHVTHLMQSSAKVVSNRTWRSTPSTWMKKWQILRSTRSIRSADMHTADMNYKLTYRSILFGI